MNNAVICKDFSSLIVIAIVGYMLPTISLVNSEVCQLSFEMENAGNAEVNSKVIIPRGNASGGFTLRFNRTNQNVTIKFSTKSQCLVQIQNITYMNDGRSDTICAYLLPEGNAEITEMGCFLTVQHTDWGKLWNTTEYSGKIGKSAIDTSFAGHHRIMLKINHTDDYGVEIDCLKLQLACLADGGECPPIGQPLSRSEVIAIASICSPVSVIAIVLGVVQSCLCFWIKRKYNSKDIKYQQLPVDDIQPPDAPKDKEHSTGEEKGPNAQSEPTVPAELKPET